MGNIGKLIEAEVPQEKFKLVPIEVNDMEKVVGVTVIKENETLQIY